jgi:hypothetical protein
MPMPRPRYNSGKKNQSNNDSFEGLSFFQRLIYVGISFIVVWGAIQVGIPLFTQWLGYSGSNMQLGTATSSLKPDPSWTLESSSKNEAGFSCNKDKAPCPSLVNHYTSTSPVTPKQLKALTLLGKVEGTCADAEKLSTGHLCDSRGKLGVADYQSYVTPKDAQGKYGIYITVSLPPAMTSK